MLDDPPEPSQALPTARSPIVPIGLAVELGLGALAVLLGRWLHIRPERTLAWTASGVAAGVLGTLPLLALLALGLRSLWGPLVRIRELLRLEILPLFRGASTLELALLAAAAGIGEELLFRGLIQGGLDRWMSVVPAAIAASLAFGLAHPITPAYSILVTVVGFYLGLLWAWTGDLAAPVVAHALYDFVALLVLLRSRTLRPPAFPPFQDEP